MSRGTWLELYEQGGLEGLLTIKKAPGKKPLASPKVVEALKERLHHPEGFRAYGEIRAYLAQEHRVSMAYSSVHALVRYRLHAKPKSPRRSHPKKTLRRLACSSPTLPTQLGAAAKTASERGYNQVRIFAQDESRIGLLPIVRHRITARGVQPTIQLRLSL